MEASNLQELKDAATELMHFACNSCERHLCEEDAEEEDGRSMPSPCSAIIRMRNALSANPIRNCDVGTAEEQAERYENFTGRYNPCSYRGYARCAEDCPVHIKLTREGLWVGELLCQLEWAQMPYEANEKGESDGSK